jgi:hypothetical protein
MHEDRATAIALRREADPTTAREDQGDERAACPHLGTGTETGAGL